MRKTSLLILCLIISSLSINAQKREHKWVNEPSENAPKEILHTTYYSKIHKTKIGYNIYLPPDYYENENKKYPVV